MRFLELEIYRQDREDHDGIVFEIQRRLTKALGVPPNLQVLDRYLDSLLNVPEKQAYRRVLKFFREHPAIE
ncbi:MAG: hypothetical protein ABSF00_00960 [Candidatus Bathyarchaeia archaeon]|jgi:hypothetical protein